MSFDSGVFSGVVLAGLLTGTQNQRTNSSAAFSFSSSFCGLPSLSAPRGRKPNSSPTRLMRLATENRAKTGLMSTLPRSSESYRDGYRSSKSPEKGLNRY
jgi:hypothetical protein